MARVKDAPARGSLRGCNKPPEAFVDLTVIGRVRMAHKKRWTVRYNTEAKIAAIGRAEPKENRQIFGRIECNRDDKRASWPRPMSTIGARDCAA